MLNKAVFEFIGRVAEAPKVSEDGKSATFTVCVNDDYQKDGEWIRNPHYFRVTVFGMKPVEYAQKKVQKGYDIVTDGKITTSQSGNGDDRQYYTNFVADRIQTQPRK